MQRRRRRGAAPGAGSTGSGRPSCLAKNVSITCFAMGAADVPCSPCSAKMTPAICGLSRGAKNTNQPLSRVSMPLAVMALLF